METKTYFKPKNFIDVVVLPILALALVIVASLICVDKFKKSKR